MNRRGNGWSKNRESNFIYLKYNFTCLQKAILREDFIKVMEYWESQNAIDVYLCCELAVMVQNQEIFSFIKSQNDNAKSIENATEITYRVRLKKHLCLCDWDVDYFLVSLHKSFYDKIKDEDFFNVGKTLTLITEYQFINSFVERQYYFNAFQNLILDENVEELRNYYIWNKKIPKDIAICSMLNDKFVSDRDFKDFVNNLIDHLSKVNDYNHPIPKWRRNYIFIVLNMVKLSINLPKECIKCIMPKTLWLKMTNDEEWIPFV